MDKIGRYEILDELGRGAMGVVLRARDPAIGRLVAIKIIRLTEFADVQERQQLRDRLFREAQSAGILSHPGIVTIYDISEENEITYITMEFVNGPTLEKVMSGEEALDPAKIVDWLRQSAAALDYAHRKGIVHRDIKPANIMIHDDGKVKITDFGIAKISTSQTMTQTGVAMGTPFYMSPEQIRGQAISGRADQFSLAVIAYEILTGGKPFHAESLPTLFFKIISEEPPPSQRINPTLGPQVDTVLRKALAKESSARYMTCTEFVNALEVACNSKKGWRPLPRGAGQSMPTLVTTTEPPARPPLPPVPRPTRTETHGANGIFGRMLAILLTLLLVGGALIYGPRLYKNWSAQKEAREQAAAQSEPAKTPAPPKPSPAPESSAPAPSEAPPAAPASTTPAASTPEVTAPTPPAPENEAPQAPPKPVETRPKPTPPPAPKTIVPSIQEVLVNSLPAGATISFDEGAKTCQAPCTVQLPSGRHTLAASLEGYHREMRIFQVADQTLALTLDMKRMAGVLRVESQPSGATITINGQKYHQTTPASITLPVGKYTVEVSKDGFTKSDQEFDIKDNSFVKINFTLPPSR